MLYSLFTPHYKKKNERHQPSSNHRKQDLELDDNLQEINGALSSFVKEMKEAQNLWDDVAIVVVLEFVGRTLVSNTGKNGT